jgi:hypothetical protein
MNEERRRVLEMAEAGQAVSEVPEDLYPAMRQARFDGVIDADLEPRVTRVRAADLRPGDNFRCDTPDVSGPGGVVVQSISMPRGTHARHVQVFDSTDRPLTLPADALVVLLDGKPPPPYLKLTAPGRAELARERREATPPAETPNP